MRRVLQADSQIFNLSGVDIIGNSNVINGSDNNVCGNSNVISGCRNTINGNSNVIRGSFNCAKGDSNMIVGSSNKYSGRGNCISCSGRGNGETISGETFPGDVITWVPPSPGASTDRPRETGVSFGDKQKHILVSDEDDDDDYDEDDDDDNQPKVENASYSTSFGPDGWEVGWEKLLTPQESILQTAISSTTEGTSNRYPGESETRMDERVEGEDNLGTACVVCWERKRRCMAQPCNHLNMCATCTREICQLAEKDNKKPLCPTCKTPIDQSVTVFIP